MPDRILVAVAWPYANGSIHIGHVAGTYLPADIFARYHRKKGNDVLMVSGSDAHGTPVTLTAEAKKITPEEVYSKYQAEFLDCWERLGITFDLFTSTHTDTHTAVTQDMFTRLFENGYVYEQTMVQPYSEVDKRFLPDRYVEGTCPHCGFDSARGDQCDKCGRTLDAKELTNIRSRISGDTPIFKETNHYFLKLSAFEDKLKEWIEGKIATGKWRPNVVNFTRGFLEGGLHDRPITRDIEWGVPVPMPGYEKKRIYVWFEAVIGYLSASIQWANDRGEPERWKEWWQDPDARAYYFMGKDNITFHTVLWPGMLMGYGGLNLPHDVPANEYLNLDGIKFTKSRNWAVWLSEYLDRFEPDPLRYVVASIMPETSDSDFTWKEYLRRNNDELVATYGNLVHRVLTISYRNFDQSVPEPGELDAECKTLLNEARTRFDEVGTSIEACHFRNGLSAAMSLAQSANRFLDARAPWKAVKTDRQNAADTLWTALTVINCLKTAMYPYLPFSSEKIHAMLSRSGSVQDVGWSWEPDELKPGEPLQEPKPLFTKLDEEIIAEEAARLAAR
ncbi:MAG: methionine--tRNA ligase [Chloroflexi bacterium]|nr:methionine--tRNA ligase [Chloroflexota bacterium]